MPKKTLEIIEEQEDNQPTGVEAETTDDETPTVRPWDPNKIRVDPKTYSLKTLLEMIASGELDLAPDFQRNNVWKAVQKCRLIESTFLRIPLPAFYFSSADDGLLQVVDGVQRLSAVRDFAGLENDGLGFALDDLEYLQKEVGGKKYKDLEGTLWLRRFNSTQVIANVIDPETPDSVKFNIFKRINTGGSRLNAQEIRHCMSLKRSREFLAQCANLSSFNVATNGKLKNHVRMVDREVVLRFCAFKDLTSITAYSANGSMDAFLTQATRKIDKEYSQEHLESLLADLDRAMNNTAQLFGNHAFRKWPLDDNRIYPFNRALFEVWGVVLSEYSWSQLESHIDVIVHQARKLMTNDADFVAAISTSTGNPQKVDTRFSRIRNLLKEITHGD